MRSQSGAAARQRAFLSELRAQTPAQAQAQLLAHVRQQVAAVVRLLEGHGVPRAESERGRVEIGLTLAGGPRANSDDLSDERVMDGLHTHKITKTTVNLLPAELKSRQVPGS